MIIGIDGNEANVKNRVGSGEYSFELLKQFEKIKAKSLKFKIYLKEKPGEDLPKTRAGWEYGIIGPRFLWTQVGLPLALLSDKARLDVFFSPSHYAPRFAFNIPVVISVMDIAYLHYPDMFKKKDFYQLKSWTNYSVRMAKKVITISKSSKNDIIEHYRIPEEKVVVVYPGIKSGILSGFETNAKFKMQNSNLLKEKYNIDGDYVLFVGTIQPRKNIARLIGAFGELLKENNFKNRKLSLVIVGKKGWLYEEIFAAPAKFGLEDKVKFLDFVEASDLPALYGNALCFIMPSLYEGFGLPVLEAMRYGCPVAASNVSSLPEAGGDAALYFDPYNYRDIAEKMKILIRDEDIRQNLIKKGFAQIKKFSWEKAAVETLEVLEAVGKTKL